MDQVTLQNQGDTDKLTGSIDPDKRYRLVINGGDIKLSGEESYVAREGTIYFDGHYGVEEHLPEGDLYVYADSLNDTSITVQLIAADSGPRTVFAYIRRVTAGKIADVGILDSLGNRINPAEEGTLASTLPRGITSWTAGVLDVSVTSWTAGVLDVVTPNKTGIVGDTITPGVGGATFAAQQVPDGFAVVVQNHPNNNDNVAIQDDGGTDRHVIQPGGSFLVQVDNLNAITVTGTANNPTVNATVEAP